MIRRFVIAALAVGLSSTSAWADTAPDPTAAALFRKGRELVDAGNWQEGCAQFRASLARYETASIVLNIARCEEHFGRVASAWALYQRGVVLARDEPGDTRREALQRVAREGVAKMEPRLPRLRVEVSSPPPELSVTESGRPLPVGQGVPLDPGSHEIVATAPGFRTLTQSVELSEGKVSSVTLTLVPQSAAAVPPPPSPTSPTAAPMGPRETSPPERDEAGVPTWAWIAGGAGLVLTGVGVGFALDSRAAADSLEKKCGGDLVCDEDPSFDPGPTNSRKNRSLGLAIGFGGIGLIAIGASVFGIVTAPSAPSAGSVQPRFAVSQDGAAFGGSVTF